MTLDLKEFIWWLLERDRTEEDEKVTQEIVDYYFKE